MTFHLIDQNGWNRIHHFHHFLNLECTFSVTANIDITVLLKELKDRGLKPYPAFMYIMTTTVNRHREFRMAFNEDDQLGYWDAMVPSYTIFHQDDQTFSSIWTEFSPSFSEFHHNYMQDIEEYGNVKGFLTKENTPPNALSISAVPWVSFTGFNLNINKSSNYLLPIITIGKFFTQDGKTMLPVSFQAHHAVCDGYHASVFMNEVQEMADRGHEWLATEVGGRA